MNNEQCLETETLCRVYLSLNPEHTATETKTSPTARKPCKHVIE